MLTTTARKLIWQEHLWIAASVCGNFVLRFLGAKVVLWWQVSSQLRSGNSFLGRPCLQTNLRHTSCLPHGLEEETVWVKRLFGQRWVHLKSESPSTHYLSGRAQVWAFLRPPLSGARESGGGRAHAQSRWGGAAAGGTRRAVGAGALARAQPLNVAPRSRGGECCLRLLSVVATGCVCDVLRLFGCEVGLEQGEEQEAAASGLPLLRAGLVFEPS